MCLCRWVQLSLTFCCCCWCYYLIFIVILFPPISVVQVYVAPIQQSSFETQSVLATCQSLAILDGELVGDPMEKATIKAIQWNITKGTYCALHAELVTMSKLTLRLWS